ncbi:MAG: PIN domain-containing protein [Chloroflexota bacterium]
MASSENTPGHPAISTLHVLVDTNVVLDLLLARYPWLTDAQPMWDAHDAGHLVVYLPASALTDVYYVCRKLVGADRARQAVEACLQAFSILAVNRVILSAALSLPGRDFEDNVQIACAQGASLSLIVTRDIDGFAHSPILAVAPSDVLGRLAHPSP